LTDLERAVEGSLAEYRRAEVLAGGAPGLAGSGGAGLRQGARPGAPPRDRPGLRRRAVAAARRQPQPAAPVGRKL